MFCVFGDISVAFRIKGINCLFQTQVGEKEPFVSELLTTLLTTIVDLEPHQIHSFYESVGPHMVLSNL